MKVTLHGEHGVVLDEFAEWDDEKNEGIASRSFGLIRWDTNQENDIEDWRGVFGSFIAAGGKELNQDYEFKFITENGTLKTKGNE